MQILIDKRVLSVLIVVLFSFFPSQQHASEILSNTQIALKSSAASEGLQLAQPTEPQTEAFALEPHDRILIYTDGIVEAANSMKALFGFNRFKEFIKSHAELPAGQLADALIRQVFNWSGKPSEDTLDDDLTLIVADYQHV